MRYAALRAKVCASGKQGFFAGGSNGGRERDW